MGKKQKREKMDKALQLAKSEFANLSNLEILNKVIYLSSGDDYDNCFTDKGSAIYDIARKELKTRLVQANFISDQDKF